MKLANGAAALDTVRALLALGRTAVLFRVGGRQAVAGAARRAMAAHGDGTAGRPAHAGDLWRVYRAVRRAKRLWPGRVMCLQTALVLQSVLRSRGIPAAVRVGVRREEGGLEAHAWVEAAGWVLDDGPGSTAYTAFEWPAPAGEHESHGQPRPQAAGRLSAEHE